MNLTATYAFSVPNVYFPNQEELYNFGYEMKLDYDVTMKTLWGRLNEQKQLLTQSLPKGSFLTNLDINLYDKEKEDERNNS